MVERAIGDIIATIAAMKKSQKANAAPVIVSVDNLRCVVGGANSIFTKPVKTVGGLDLPPPPTNG